MATLKDQTRFFSHNLNARAKSITPSEKDVIKTVLGNDSEIPQIIYNRIQQNLNIGKNTNAVLKVKLPNGSSHWTKNRFEPSKNNQFKNKFTVKTELLNNHEIKINKKLYNALNKIEKHMTISHANKFLDGYLEDKCISFNELVRF